jgi:hypothetical protein
MERKWRSLTRNQTVAFLFGLVGIVIGAAGLVFTLWASKESVKEATGEGTFCYFWAVPNQGRGNPPAYPLTVWVRGKYPMRNVVASINETGSTNPDDPVTGLRNIPLGDGTLVPGVHPINEDFRIRLGKHVIQIWSRTGLSTQTIELKMAGPQLVQTGDVWNGGRKLYQFDSARSR